MARENRVRTTSAEHQEPLFTPILSPQIFRAVETLARDALVYGGSQKSVRNSVVGLIQELRNLSEDKLGHDSPEVVALQSLLRRYDLTEFQRPPARPDPITMLENAGIIDKMQVQAAHEIMEIWNAFGRFQAVSARNYERQSGGKKGRVMSPLDVMGEDLWSLWKTKYVPWYNRAQRTFWSAMDRSRKVSSAGIVVFVVIEEHDPTVLNKALKLYPGIVINILRTELSLFADPHSAFSSDTATQGPPPSTPFTAAARQSQSSPAVSA